MVVGYQGAPCLIESVTVQTPSARGVATIYKFRAWNLKTKKKVDITLRGEGFPGGCRFPAARPVKFLYTDNTHCHFMDQETFDQYSLTHEEVEDERPYLTEELEASTPYLRRAAMWPFQIPVAVELRIVECTPAVRGCGSATSRNKPAKLETGLLSRCGVSRSRRQGKSRYPHRRIPRPRGLTVVLERPPEVPRGISTERVSAGASTFATKRRKDTRCGRVKKSGNVHSPDDLLPLAGIKKH